MSDQNVINYKTGNIDKTDKSLNTSEKCNQNDNSIVPSQLDIKISNNDTISDNKVVYLKSCSMSKKKKIIIASIIGGIILIGVILAIVLSLHHSKPPSEKIKHIPDDTIWIDHNISSKIFRSTRTEETKTNFGLEKLNDRLKTKTINSEILFDIYEIDDELINGYVIILSREEFLDKQKINSFNDTNKKDSNYNAVAKVSFYQNGTIKELSFSANSNEVYTEELKELIEGIIPNLNGKIEQGDYKFTVSNDSNYKIAIGEDALVGSNADSNLATNVENNFVKDFTLKKEYYLQNSDYDNNNNDLNKNSAPETVSPKDSFKNDLETINSLIQSVDITINMNTSFEKNLEDETVEEYENKLKNINFSSETSSKGLRLLSKEEYEKNIKLQNKIINGFKNLRNLQSPAEYTSSMEFPFAFNYELFKTNMLGVQIAIIASINWIPTDGTILIRLYYVRGKNTSEIKTESININNFSDVTKSYKTIIITIINYLQTQIISYIDDYNINISDDSFKKYIDNFNNTLSSLSTLFVNYLQTDLEKFKNDVMNYVLYCYNDLFDYMTDNLLPLLKTIEDQIKTGAQNEIKNIVNESKTTVLNLINIQNQNLTKLIESVYTFIENSKNTITSLKSYQKIGIDFYYRVKEIFKRIDVLIDNYESTLKNSIEAEYLQLQTYVNDNIYLGEMDAYIDKIEIVWDIFHYNEILNQTVTFDHATGIVESLGNVRSRYLEIKKKLLDEVKKTYDNLINKELKTSSSNIKALKTGLNKKETALIDLIKERVLYITNYEIYSEDIKKIIEVENKMSELRINGYKQYIFNKINDISTDNFLSSSNLNSIQTTINNEIDSLLNNLKNNNVQSYKDNYKNILSEFENLLSTSKINEYINAIKSKVGSNDVLTYINEYYDNIINTGLSQLKEVTDNIINNRLDDYINTPNELINKIKSISNNEKVNSNINELNDKISLLINDKMANLFNDIISRIDNFIRTQVNNIRNSIPNSYLVTTNKIIETGNFYSQSIELTENLKNKLSDYLSSLKSNVNVKSNIEEKEKLLNSNITKFADEIKTQFDTIFCVKEGCKSLTFESMDEYDKYYFQVSKFRDALNHLTLLEPYINDVITDDNLKGLSSNDFLNLYKNPNNFDVNTVNGKIKELLYNLFKQGMENTQKNVDNLKKQIKEGFSTNYVNISEYVFPNFFRTLFNKNDYLDEKLNVLLIDISRKLRNGTTQDTKVLKKKEFFFDGSKENIEIEFNNSIKEYLKVLEDEENAIKSSLDLSDSFKNQIVDKFKEKFENDFDKYYKELKNMFSARTAKNCILLDNQRTLEDILNEAYEEIKDEVKNVFYSGIEFLLNDLLKSLRDEIIDEYFDYFNNNFKGKYRKYFDSIRNYLLQNTNVNSKNITIKSIPENTVLGFKEGLNLAISELRNLIDLDKMMDYKNDTDVNNLLINLLNKFTFETKNNLQENLDINIDDLKAVCDQELISEKDSFKESLLDYIEVGFNLTVKNFINGPGVSYLDGLFTDDYKNKIVPKLNYILTQCKEIDEYLKLLIEDLFDFDSYITDSVKEVYNQLLNYINDGITQEKVSAKILKKILDFKYDSAEKIINYFNDYTLDILSTNSLKLSEQVKLLIITNIPKTVLLNFTNFYYEILDSAYLKNIHNTYSTKIIEKRENIIKDIEKFRLERSIQIGGTGQGTDSLLSSAITEYNKLNASLSKINNDFTFELSDSKKQNAHNLLANNTLKQFLKNILKIYYDEFEYVQNQIKSNVFLEVDINTLSQKIQSLFDSLNDNLDENAIKKDREEFMYNFSLKYNNLQNYVLENYELQVGANTLLKSLNKKRRLDVDIKIENVQFFIDQIDYKLKNLILNIFNSEKLIELQSTLNKITSQINIQLILLDNKLESYIKYAEFYLTKDNLQPYRNNATSIYNKVENILENYLKNQNNLFNEIIKIIEEYSVIFNNDVKPKLLEQINNVIKIASNNLITNYLNNSESNKEENVYNFEKTTNLTYLEGLSTVLGSTRLNYSTNIQNIILKWGHKFTIDPNNYKVNLSITAGGYADGYIVYHNDYYNTSVGGAFANGKIGLNLTNDYLNEIVYATYYTEYKNSSVEKILYEFTKLDSWDVCKDVVDCFVGKNDDYCPYNVIVEDQQYNIFKPDVFDTDYYKNKSIYVFNGYYENNLCTYANYFYGIEESNFEFGSELYMTV